ERGYDVTYLRCSDIKDRLQLLDQLTSERGPAARPLVIALDGYDEANLLRLDKKDIKREVLTALFEISFRPRVFVILNSRLIPMSEESIYLGIANLMYDLRQQDSTTVVELKPFRKPQIEAWLDAYSNAKAKRGYEQRLFREDLGHLHKNLANACHNPLFLYMLAARFYEAGIERLTDVYDLYESFVDNTVTGKFRFEKRQAASIAEVSRHYRAFLREMALAISATNDLEFDSKTLDAWNLDANDRLYSIPYATVRETIEKTAERLLDPVDLGDIDRRRLINNVLTCYFLAESGDRWRFTDNNILFFLLAEALLLATKHTVTKGSIEGFASAFTSALNSPTIPLHPLSVELLLLRLASEPSEERERISEFLAELFRMPLVLTAGSGSKQLDPQEVRRLATLLVVIFLRVSERKYSELSDFLSSLQIHLRMLAKTDVRAYDILRSFFRSLTVREGRFDGFDFDGFNFQGSLFESVKFEKCRFCDPVFDHLVLDGERAEFRHCTLERVDARSVSGRARFEASEVELRLTDPGDLDLHFENCHVKDLNIHAKRHTHPAKVRVSVDGGRVDHLILRKLVVERLELRNCEHPVLKLEGSKVWLLRVNARCTSKRIVSKDGQSKIYEVKD
ncbi:MAG: hypothetical protein OES32_17175, partial [Acidobacteriota bacterium]|nr:hypothetical protein [Acidobacteriota bacterium]